MPRFKLTIEYDGTNYCGWQIQPDVPTVQGVVEHAIYAFCRQNVPLTCAGRTDAGVHALGQVVHADIDGDYSAFRVQEAINAHLRDHPVVVREACLVDDNFSARFDATSRHYHYRIINRRAPCAVQRHYVWQVKAPLNVSAMQQASHYFVGRHDFSSFRDSQCQARSPVRTLDACDIVHNGDAINVYVSALSFLHHQVRIMVGTLVDIGKGKYDADVITDMIAARSRCAGGITAPARGLHFVRVDYPLT